MVLKTPPWGYDPFINWDEYNETKIFQHGITWREVEECFDDSYTVGPHNKAKSEPDKYGDRYIIIGRTYGGRELFIVVQFKGGNEIRPVTAFDYTK